MKIPKYILKTIKNIENCGNKLEIEEQKLYHWLDKNNLDYDFDNKYDDYNLDMWLHQLFTFHDGSGLIKLIEDYNN